MNHEPKNVNRITCSSRSDQAEYTPREMYDCSVQHEDGTHSMYEAYELNINADVQITDNPNIGEVHIKPNKQELKITEDRGELRINDMDKVIKGKN